MVLSLESHLLVETKISKFWSSHRIQFLLNKMRHQNIRYVITFQCNAIVYSKEQAQITILKSYYGF